MKKKILPAVWLLSVLLLGVLASILSGESTHFYGIADDQEQTISFESSVEIVRTLVVEGEEVQRGDLLMEVRRESLNSSLAIVDDELQELVSRNKEQTATLKSQLVSLKANQEAQRADLDGQIKSLQSRLELNKSFLQQITNPETQTNDSESKAYVNPLLDEINGLKTQQRHLMEAVQAEIGNIELQLSANERPIDAQIAGLEDKRTELLRQVSNLQIRANFSGRVGSLLFKAGETVSPYQAILTVHSSSPSYVKAYINENVVNKVKLGQKVWVQSSTSLQDIVIIAGKVESLGSRIVEYPDRLKKNRYVSAWGREVIVRLEQSHSLLLGEKVIVQLIKPGSMLAALLSSSDVVADVISEGIATAANGSVPSYTKIDTAVITSTKAHIVPQSIEASGILNDAVSGGYLLISDEAKQGAAEIYHLNRQATIIDKVEVNIKQADVPKIDDLESISSDGEYIYISASLSHNKRDVLKPKRRQLIRLQKTGKELSFRGAVDLYASLEGLSKTSSHAATRRFLKTALRTHSMDIEAHSVVAGDLYLGFKSPLNTKGETIIIKVNDVAAIFSGQPATGKIWQTLNLQDSQNGEPTMLSDMLLQGDQLLLLTVKDDKHHPVSHLWSFNVSSEKLTELAQFKDLKAEGITQSLLSSHQYMLVFDGNSKTESRHMTINTEKLLLAGDM